MPTVLFSELKDVQHAYDAIRGLILDLPTMKKYGRKNVLALVCYLYAIVLTHMNRAGFSLQLLLACYNKLFDFYDELMEELMENGIPLSEINASFVDELNQFELQMRPNILAARRNGWANASHCSTQFLELVKSSRKHLDFVERLAPDQLVFDKLRHVTFDEYAPSQPVALEATASPKKYKERSAPAEPKTEVTEVRVRRSKRQCARHPAGYYANM